MSVRRKSDGSATATAGAQIDRMKPVKGESVKDFAARLYEMQMEVYSAYAGRDLGAPFYALEQSIQRQWISLAKEKMGAA